MPIVAPKITVFGGFDPINGAVYQQNPKRHILACKNVMYVVIIGPLVRPVCVTKRPKDKERNFTVQYNGVFAQAPHVV